MKEDQPAGAAQLLKFSLIKLTFPYVDTSPVKSISLLPRVAVYWLLEIVAVASGIAAVSFAPRSVQFGVGSVVVKSISVSKQLIFSAVITG